ncbi:hypothetical protein D9M68_702580 [compost metagenome]
MGSPPANLHIVENWDHRFAQGHHVRAFVLGTEVEHEALRLGDLLRDASALLGQLHQALAGGVQAASPGALHDDLGVMLSVRRARDVPHDLGGVDDGQIATREFWTDLRQGDAIRALFLRVATQNQGVQGGVVGFAEVGWGQEGADLFAEFRLVHQRAKNALLGFQRYEGAIGHHSPSSTRSTFSSRVRNSRWARQLRSFSPRQWASSRQSVKYPSQNSERRNG